MTFIYWLLASLKKMTDIKCQPHICLSYTILEAVDSQSLNHFTQGHNEKPTTVFPFKLCYSVAVQSYVIYFTKFTGSITMLKSTGLLICPFQ